MRWRSHIRITRIESSDSRDYVILIHGLGVTEKVWIDPLNERLKFISFKSLLKNEKMIVSFADRLKEGFNIVTWTQKKDSTVEESAKELVQICRILSQKRFFLIGHSRGGLVARYAIQKYEVSPVATICLSTPHYGSGLADIVIRRWYVSTLVRPWLGDCLKAIAELGRHSSFISSLNDPGSVEKESHIPHFDIAGNRTHYFRFLGLNILESVEAIFGKNSMPEIRNGAGDGFVSIGSARSPLTTSENFYLLPVNHLNILIDKRVQDIVFELLQKFK